MDATHAGGATIVALDPAPAALTADQKRAIAAATLGTVVEWTDWLIYATFAPLIAAQFFPPGDPVASLLSTFAIFAVGFVMRPIGGAVLGAFADRYGRKRGLTLSISLMALASCVIGLCPGYASIGILAPAILILARLIQGFSAGGEFGSASAFLIESAPPNRRAFAGSWQHLAINAGVLVASCLGFALTFVADDRGMSDWGWRIGFIVAGCMGFITLWIRNAVRETEVFERRAATRTLVRHPFRALIRDHQGAALRVIGIAMAGNLVNYIWMVSYPSYVHITTGMPLRQSFVASIVSVGASLLVIPFVGLLADRIGRRPVLITFAFGSALYAWPSLMLITNDLPSAIVIETIALVLSSGFAATCAAVMAEQFPSEIRATGVALPYAISVTLFGGTAPYIVTAMKGWGYGDMIWLYVAAVCIIGGFVYVGMRETKGEVLR
ncbi:MFS transporter [Methylobacterium nodulans]|uniref:General substrate transporter n=1 Tax=Methylobacterium nodulans (strain LMG 21967 / CNCM I-2342 / ORS 2060) TaxID=460265 RepID=B8INN1_METNO|nr:MFS transporter [Methylobacterium nodulans]ACL58397.1 General substrate transporter [Methylobacterium nodulans ORS 2060]